MVLILRDAKDGAMFDDGGFPVLVSVFCFAKDANRAPAAIPTTAFIRLVLVSAHP